jgi:uncharacterized protein YcbK (DUF882 family)
MGDLTANFSRSEFACKCGCGLDTIDYGTVYLCQRVRDFFERRVTVTSGVRCLDHNASVGSTPASQHVHFRAADIVVEGIDPKLVYEYLDDLGVPGLGSYADFTHLDTRSGPKARWTG